MGLGLFVLRVLGRVLPVCGLGGAGTIAVGVTPGVRQTLVPSRDLLVTPSPRRHPYLRLIRAMRILVGVSSVWGRRFAYGS